MSTLIRQALIFDGTEMIGPLDLLIRGALIEQIAPTIDVHVDEVVEATGKTLMPGLIDCHVHTFADALSITLPFGVSTVIDMFTDVGFAAEMRREQLEGKADYRADLVSAGNLATAPGGHGTQYGVPVATLSSPGEAYDFVQARIDEGSDFIKIIWEPGDGTWPTLDEATIKAVIDAAHRRGKMAAIHISRYEHARRSIEMGVDGLAHIFNDEPPEDDFGRLVAEADAFAIPTLSVRAGSGGIAIDLIEEDHFGSYLMPSQESSLRNISGRTNEHRTSNAGRAVRLMVEAGVAVLAGTDAPNPGTAHGASMHRELELLARCGMSPTEVLAAATSKPAKIFGLADRGVIAQGKVADLLLVDGDPSVDVSATRRIVAVFKRGKRFDREGYLDNVVAAREAAAVPAPTPPKEALENGLISDFENGLDSSFGAGWTPTTDILGGKSEAKLTLVTEGAEGTRGALRVTGETQDGYLFPWAGVMFSPGGAPMEAADLSSKRGISFWARGDAGEFSLAVMAKSRGYLPATKRFQLDGEWMQHEISFADLGLDATDITAIMFVCYEKRSFSFEIDQVRLRPMNTRRADR